MANAPYPAEPATFYPSTSGGPWVCCMLLSVVGLLGGGCNNSSQDAETNSRNSNYAVAEEKKSDATSADSVSANESVAPPATTPAPADSPTDPNLANKAAAPPPTAGTIGASSPTAPANPPPVAGSPTTPAPAAAGSMPAQGKTGGVVNEAPSFATLSFPTSEETTELISFLVKADQALRDLSVWGSQGMVPEAQFRSQAARIVEMKMTAISKLLGKKDLSEADLKVARKGKLQALSQLSSLGDVKANDALRTFVEEVSGSDDPELIHEARLMQLGYAAEALMNGKSKDPQELLSRIDEVLADENYRGAPEIVQVRQATVLLEQMGYKEQAYAARQKLGKLFENNKDPSLATAAWQMLSQGHPAVVAVEDALKGMAKGEASAKDQLKQGAEQMVAELPPERTVLFLAGQIIEIEFSGQPEAASVIYDVVTANMDKITNESVKTKMNEVLEGFKLRQSLVGKELSFAGLVDTEGKPLDWNAYAGKVVLVDFWATWCQPCLIELPNVEKTYAALKDKGFEVIGINLDDNPADLQAFFKQKTLPWSTFRNADASKTGFEMPLAKELGLQAIPFVFLIGKDGKVAKLHVRGEALIPAVEELLK